MRYLRIAFSATCLIACVLLIALWVRSYSFLDFCEMNVAHGKTLHIQSVNGRLLLFGLSFNRGSKVGSFSVGTCAPSPLYNECAVTGAAIPGGGVSINVMGTGGGIKIPIWIPVSLAMALASLPWFPWLRWRYSVRTLLIATTLVAVVLGLIVWATR